MLKSLPEAVLLHLLEFLNYRDQVECVFCRKEWLYSIFNPFLRKISLPESKLAHFETLQISFGNPYQQVTILLGDEADSNVRLLSTFNYCVSILRGSGRELASLSQCTHQVRIKHIEIYFAMNTAIYDIVSNYLSSMVYDLQQLHIDLVDIDVVLPYIPSLRILEILNSSHPSPVSASYCSQLYRLKLFYCSLLDVNGFDHIPVLELVHCENINDISSLKYNQKVRISGCEQITDSTKSLEDTISISLHLFYQAMVRVDLTHWRKVKHLTFEFKGAEKSLEFISGNALPEHIQSCGLLGNISSLVDFRLDPAHALRELTLENIDTITTFQGYGFEQLVIIKILSSRYLETLEGLGSGRNQRIVLESCPRIRDFSPLRYVTSVSILSCDGFSSANLADISHVKHFEIKSTEKLDFSDRRSERHWESLDLTGASNLVSFQGLERVPYLKLNKHHITPLSKFLQKGKQLENTRIDLILPHDEDLAGGLSSLYDQSFLSEYDVKTIPVGTSSLLYCLVHLRK